MIGRRSRFCAAATIPTTRVPALKSAPEVGATDLSDTDAARLISWSLVPGTLILVARVVYEEMLLTGPQSFTFSHQHPVLAVWSILSYYATGVWLGAVVLKAAMSEPKSKLLADHRVVLSILSVLLGVGLVAGVGLP